MWPNFVRILLTSTPQKKLMISAELYLSKVLNKCLDRNRLKLAGDINLRPSTKDFEALSELLEEEEIILRSDPSIPTYFHSSSTLDHIFAPVRMDVLNTLTT